MKTAAFCESYNHNNHTIRHCIPVVIQRSPGKVLLFSYWFLSRNTTPDALQLWPKWFFRQPCGGHHHVACWEWLGLSGCFGIEYCHKQWKFYVRYLVLLQLMPFVYRNTRIAWTNTWSCWSWEFFGWVFHYISSYQIFDDSAVKPDKVDLLLCSIIMRWHYTLH